MQTMGQAPSIVLGCEMPHQKRLGYVAIFAQCLKNVNLAERVFFIFFFSAR